MPPNFIAEGDFANLPPIKAYIVKKIDYELFSNFHIMFVFVHHKLVKSNHVV